MAGTEVEVVREAALGAEAQAEAAVQAKMSAVMRRSVVPTEVLFI